MCIGKCENFAHNYVSNPNNMKCEYCGPTCVHCTLQYGCSKCLGSKGRSSDPREYLDNLDETKKSAVFPFSFSPYTKFGAPSSAFATCIDCDNYDERCDSCYDAVELYLSNKNKDSANSTTKPERKRRMLAEEVKDKNSTTSKGVDGKNQTDGSKNETATKKKVMDKVPIDR